MYYGAVITCQLVDFFLLLVRSNVAHSCSWTGLETSFQMGCLLVCVTSILPHSEPKRREKGGGEEGGMKLEVLPGACRVVAPVL